MTKVRRVVVGIDFHDPAIDAERWIASCLTPGAELVLVHVLEVPPTPSFLTFHAPVSPGVLESARAGAEARLRELSLTFGERLSWLEVRVGDPARELCAVAREYGADLMVVGKHGLGVGQWGRFGATAERLVRQAPAPVIVAFGTPSGLPRRVLVALDDGPDSARIAEWAAALCTNGGERITAIHVLSNAVLSHMLSTAATRSSDIRDDLQVRDELHAEARQWLDRVLCVRPGGAATSSIVAFGDPATEILAEAERMHADLIVVGSRGQGRVRQALLGSVAREVLRGANRPVLVVTAPEDEIDDSSEVLDEAEPTLAAASDALATR